MDNSPEMLAICRAKAEKMNLLPNLYEQNLETLNLPRKYRTILAPSSALQLITDVDRVREAVRRVFDHLEPGGGLVASFAFEWRAGDLLETEWKLLFDKVRPEDGATVRSWVREWHEPEKQLWHSEQRFEVELKGEVIARQEHRHSPEGRSYTQAQAAQLYADAGFTEIQLFHGFELSPALPDDKLFCVLGVKP